MTAAATGSAASGFAFSPEPSPRAGPRRVAWFNCYSGIAGDMALGSLVDAGADVAQLFRLLEQLPIGGWSLDFEPVMRNGLAATRAVVGTRGDVVVRTFVHIVGVIEEARLPDRVRDRALAAFQALAEVEGRLHRRPVAQVHFHEVGGHDTIVDIVGTAAALEILGVDTVMSSEVATGTGIVRTSHGILPNPAPAVVALLAGIPTAGRDLNIELTTPTGAAILSAWGSRFGPMPGMVVEATGFGAGSREIDGIPNCTQVVVGELTSEGVPYNGQHLLLLEANLDDATGETLAHAIERLMAEGALDAWLTPILMKKGRPAYTLSVLCDTSLAGALCGVMVAETGTLGVRATSAERWAVDRSVGEVTLGGLAIRVKVSPGRVKAEQGDVAKVAGRIGLPGLEVAAQAEAAWRRPTPIGGEPGEGTASVADIGAAREADVGHGTGTGSGSAREPDFGRGPRDGAGGREPDFGRGPRDGAGGRDAPEGDDDLSPPPLGA